ncbi:unnamed protein product, partial [Staurois parvus]
LITSGFFLFFLKPQTTKNFEKKKIFLVCYKIL